MTKQHYNIMRAAFVGASVHSAAWPIEALRSLLVPLNGLLCRRADACAFYMTHELGFEFAVIWGYDLVRPFKLWPHTEVVRRDCGANIMFLKAFKGPQYKMFSPRDIMLLEDPAKREICVEAHTICMAPCWRQVARSSRPRRTT